MGKALVTGASGFIGGHLIRRLLARGDDVTALVRSTSHVDALQSSGARLARGDVADPASLAHAVAGCDVVYHLAGLTMALRRDDLMRVNAEGTRNVARACAERTTPPVLVVVSSIAAAGPAAGGRPLVETDAPRPVSHYGRSKRSGEIAAAESAGHVPTTIVRPPIVLGEGDRASLPMFTSVAHWRVHIVPGLRDERFSLIHADDLAAALMLAADRGSRLDPSMLSGMDRGYRGNSSNGIDAGEDVSTNDGDGRPLRLPGVYFAAADESPTYAELGRMIAQAVGLRGVYVIRQPSLSVWAVAGATEVVAKIRRRPIIFNLDKAREAMAGSWVCSSRALREDTGFAPEAPLSRRLLQTSQWYADQGWLKRPGSWFAAP